ncbi:pisatin demethylase [Venturia nashicola]|uniref:Pisatin demethylase n=1 Tax=Venturia nashicola TaxID=86259 RepID=A0A4Z1PA63_9PEZI|nr:pisatin demethylase [Venturia nashicola]
MLLNTLVSLVRDFWPLIIPSVVVAYFLRNKYGYGLNRYPGPFLAGFTDLWRFYDAHGRKSEKTFVALHEKYGDVVRIGPNVLSFADPKAIKTIYGLNKGFTKSEFYPVQQGVVKGKRLPSLFSTTDEGYHARYRRCVNSIFAMSSLVSYEPLVDSTTALFLAQTEKLFASRDATCSFSQWLQFYAFDVIGELTWSKPIGFIEKNQDIDGIIGFISKFLDYAGPIGQLPILDHLLNKNVLKMYLQRHFNLFTSEFPATKFALDRSAQRASEMELIKTKGLSAIPSNNEPHGIDFLAKFTQAQYEHPEFMTDNLVLTSCLSMVLAGSETTAISLSSIFYHLLRNPSCYQKLMQEIKSAVEEGVIPESTNEILTWKTSQTLPYLDAVVQESFRLHPAAGLMLERVTPASGLNILNHAVPGGTIVGCNAWVLHRRPEIFGSDVNVFRPERWLEADPQELKEMKATMFQFGAGARTCIGRNISLLEIYKLVPSFLRRFEIELVEPGREWKTVNSWFVRQEEFDVRFKLREEKV